MRRLTSKSRRPSRPKPTLSPDDTTNVPVMPNSTAPGAPDPSYGSGDVHAPAADNDPVRSPDDPAPDPSAGSDSSSSSAALDKLLPPPDTGPSGRKGNKAQEPEHSESAKEDENVGTYYLSEKNWKAALSRFESAVVSIRKIRKSTGAWPRRSVISATSLPPRPTISSSSTTIPTATRQGGAQDIERPGTGQRAGRDSAAKP